VQILAAHTLRIAYELWQLCAVGQDEGLTDGVHKGVGVLVIVERLEARAHRVEILCPSGVLICDRCRALLVVLPAVRQVCY
jgi:hypothetical protein